MGWRATFRSLEAARKRRERIEFRQNRNYEKIERKTLGILAAFGEEAQKELEKIQKYENQKGGIIVVDLILKDSKHLLVRISDNGIGIPNDMMDKLLEPYVTTKASGTGLGLAIVNKILKDHGSKLEFLSNSKGASFYFELTIS